MQWSIIDDIHHGIYCILLTFITGSLYLLTSSTHPTPQHSVLCTYELSFLFLASAHSVII